MANEPFTIAAFYHFTDLQDADQWEPRLRAKGEELNLLGTLLLAEEGVNATLAGTRQAIDNYLAVLFADPRFASMQVKFARSDEPPFGFFRLKRKQEIVTFRQPEADPRDTVGTYVAPADWNTLISDPEVITIDTRNTYEVEIGQFAGAIHPETEHFSSFSAWVEQHIDTLRKQKVAMYCTGGIRCERATAYLKKKGIEEVYHLEGGILNYLEKVPQEQSLWQGECFVFDNRVAVDHQLEPSQTWKMDSATGRPVPVAPPADAE